MDFAVIIKLLSELVGGLGIFLLGMKFMSDGMQAVAGNSLRRTIGIATNNRIFAIIAGVFVTCVVQSSSITTVMVVGFVNSGVMSLVQAVGVVMGANIGTTITGWILVLKIGKYGLPLLGVAAFVYLFSKRERWRYIGMALMGVGMIFFGLEVMKDACKFIRDEPAFLEWFQSFKADTYIGVLQCALVGCVLTTLVQSSSATLGITITLATQGVISFETAAALVLGENIGTTITAYLASLGATTNAKRAAYFHVIFNLAGVLWITLIFSPYIQFIQWLIPGEVAEVVMNEGVKTYPNTTAAIAATHTVFNVANTLLFIPFVPFFVSFLNRLVPAKEFKEKPQLTDLDGRFSESPVLGIEQSQKEIEKMSSGCIKMMDWLNQLREQDDPDKALGDKLKHREQVLDSVQDEVAEFITKLLSANMPQSAAEEARQQLRLADEFESISDYIADMDKFDRKLRRDGHRFTPDQRNDLAALNGHVATYIETIDEALRQKNQGVLTKTEPMSKRIRSEIKQLRRKHLEDLSNGAIPPVVCVAYLATLNAYARVRDHAHNIAEVVSGEK